MCFSTMSISSLVALLSLFDDCDVVVALRSGLRSSFPSCIVCMDGINVSCTIWDGENQSGFISTSFSSSRLLSSIYLQKAIVSGDSSVGKTGEMEIILHVILAQLSEPHEYTYNKKQLTLEQVHQKIKQK